LAQAALIARTALSESSLVRSTPLISAPQADDSGVTSMSRMSCCRANIDSGWTFLAIGGGLGYVRGYKTRLIGGGGYQA